MQHSFYNQTKYPIGTALRCADASTGIGSYGYTLDLDGKRLGATLPDGKTWAYGYDGLNQVTGGTLSDGAIPVSSHAYTYDTIGNRLTAADNGATKQYTANDLNQYTAINDANLQYDADGNLLSDGEFTYTYDALNQLISVEKGFEKQLFRYDFMGRRIASERYTRNRLTSRRRYIYQQWNVIAEYENGEKVKTYLWGEDLSGTLQGAGGVGGLLLERNATGDYPPIYDGNGNIIAYKNASGDTVATYSYDPFGNIIANTGINFSYKFSTKPQDELSGLYYYGYRFYSPKMGRWLSRDPIGEKASINLHLFLENKTLYWYDYLGLTCCGNVKLKDGQKCCGNETRGKIYDPSRECCCNALGPRVADISEINNSYSAMMATISSAYADSSNYFGDSLFNYYIRWNQCLEQAQKMESILFSAGKANGTNEYWRYTPIGGAAVVEINADGYRVSKSKGNGAEYWRHHVLKISAICKGDCPYAGKEMIIDPLVKDMGIRYPTEEDFRKKYPIRDKTTL